jgi:nucleoside-diphosphate-sugar epimerase
VRVLVAGGTEFISLHLVQALLRDGHQVTVLNRGRQPGRLPAGVQTLIADRKDHAALRKALAGERFDGTRRRWPRTWRPCSTRRPPSAT